MAEKHEFATLFRASLGDAVVLIATLGIVVFRNLAEGIIAGFAVAALLFLHRMAKAVEVVGIGPILEEDVADFAREGRKPYDPAVATDPDIFIYRISGAFFFGAASAVAAALDRIGEHPRAYIVDFSAVPIIDSTAAATIKGFVQKAGHGGAAIYFAGTCPLVARELGAHGLQPPRVQLMPDVATALTGARTAIANGGTSAGVASRGRSLPDAASRT
jgi:SulP family sulfate permease